MVKLNKKNLQFAILLAVVLVIVSGLANFGSQSIVSVSNIDIVNGGEVVQAELAVNQFDTVWFIPQDRVKLASSGVFADVTKDVKVEVQPEGVFCTVPMRQTSVTNGIITVPYYESLGSYSKDVITTVKVSRANFASGLYDEIVGQTSFNACKIGNCEGPTTNTVTYNTIDLGEVKVENLGNLDGGLQCPDAGEVAVVRDNQGKWIPIDKDDLIFDVRNESNCLGGNIGACIDFIANAGYKFPDGHSDCPVNTTCESGFNVVSNVQLIYQLPTNSSVSLVTVNMNKEFIGAVLFQPPQVHPQIVSTNLTPNTPKTGEQGAFTVNVKNTGDTGTVRVTVWSQNSKSSISPSESTRTITGGGAQTVTYTFQVNSILEGSERLQVLAEGIGSGGTSTQSTFEYNIIANTGVCGNNVCDLGEQITCPSDCIVPTHLECINLTCTEVTGEGENTCDVKNTACEAPPLVCDSFFDKKVSSQQTVYLIDFYGIKLFPLQTVQVESCEFDYTKAILLGVIVFFGAFIFRKVIK